MPGLRVRPEAGPRTGYRRASTALSRVCVKFVDGRAKRDQDKKSGSIGHTPMPAV